MKQVVYILSTGNLYTDRGAAVERLQLYAKAIAEAQVDVKLASFDLCNSIDQSINNWENPQIIGQHHGLRRLKGMQKFRNQRRYLNNLIQHISHSDEKPVFLLFPDSLSTNLLALFMLKFQNKYPVFCEKNELKTGIVLNFTAPSSLVKRLVFYVLKPLLLLEGYFNDQLCFLYDGIIAISRNIERWLMKRNKNVIRIPILADSQLIAFHENKPKSSVFRIGFAGALSPKKEGLTTFLYGLASSEYRKNNVHFDIYGIGNSTETNILKRCIKELELEDHVFLKGSVPKEVLQQELCHYDLLILTRPENIQTRYGFSTKLSEYMMAGVPPLVTDVSDNALYIQDNKNGFVISGNKSDIIGNKLTDIYMMRNRLDDVGKQSRETAMLHFNYLSYSNTLYKFLIEAIK